MNSNNVNSNAKIITNNETQEFKFGNFINNNTSIENINSTVKLDDKSINGNVDPVMIAINSLTNQLSNIEQKVSNIESNGIKGKDLDAQLITALRDLKNYAQFFEQATFQLESKILRTSMNIAQKIINVEIGEQSEAIAIATINNILSKIKTASQITIHLNPKDYLLLKDELKVESFVKIQEDPNVTIGGVVIASDLGNFDGNIEAKVQTILESLDTVI
jgi:flagellar assembly protein FliH